MIFISVILIFIISAVIDYPLIMKASQIEEESQDPANLRTLLVYAVAAFFVPSVVTVVVYKLLL